MRIILAVLLLIPSVVWADPPVPTQQEIDYRKCLSAVGPRNTWAPGYENCPALILAWREANLRSAW